MLRGREDSTLGGGPVVGTLVSVGVVALLLGACLGWLERGRRCRSLHAHLVDRHEPAGLDVILATPTDGRPDLAGGPASEAPAASEIRPGRFPGSALPGPNGAAPGPAYVVKAKLRSRIYRTTSSASYAQTIPEVWFRSPEDAEAAGFRAPRPPVRADPLDPGAT